MSIKKSDIYTLLTLTGSATGTGTNVADVTGFTAGPAMQVIISATATVAIQESLDQVNWVTTNTISASDTYVLDIRGCFYRANCTANTGNVTVLIGPGLTIGGQLAMTRGPASSTAGP